MELQRGKIYVFCAYGDPKNFGSFNSIYQEPSIFSTVLGKVPYESHVIFLEGQVAETTSLKWYMAKVIYGDVIGWVACRFDSNRYNPEHYFSEP